VKEPELENAQGTKPLVLPAQPRTRLFFHLGVLIWLLTLGSPFNGLIEIPISFLLKNKLHLEAQELAHFRLLSAVPLYFSFAFGFLRDWDPLHLGDRGLLVLFGVATAALYIAFAFIPATYETLLAAMLVLTTGSLFMIAVQNGLTAVIGQRHEISGQISALWNFFLVIPSVAAFLLGGMLSELLESGEAGYAARMLFLIGAVIAGAVACLGRWGSDFLFEPRVAQLAPSNPTQELKRLLQHRPIYPALLIWLLWNFAPGSLTPLQYFLQNDLSGGDAVWGQWNAIFTASFAPAFIGFGLLCRRLPLKTLLWWGTIAAIPQMLPLLLIHSPEGALVAAVPIGLMGGLATAAYTDLLIRSAPHGLEGTAMMTSSSVYFIATRFGDVLGAHIYDFGGFVSCVSVTVVVYVLILPSILLIPRYLVATPDA
jgi:predicted MFS family arabinose efflux permease